MRVERHPYNFDVRGQYPNARVFRGWEGGCAYKAERDGKPFIIVDEGTMADFLDESDPADREMLSRLISVIEFEDETEREGYITREMSFGVNLEGQRSPHGMSYWVYEHWTAEHKAVIHSASCRFCNDGQGCHENPLGNRNGQWLGPFESLDGARAAAANTHRPMREHSCVSAR